MLSPVASMHSNAGMHSNVQNWVVQMPKRKMPNRKIYRLTESYRTRFRLAARTMMHNMTSRPGINVPPCSSDYS